MRSLSRVALLIFGLCCAITAGAKTVTLGEADNRTLVVLNLGDTLIVDLPSTLPGQYGWVSHLAKGAALTAQGDSLIPVKGAGSAKGEGTRQFRYNAARVGEMVLNLAFEMEKKQGAGVPETSRFSVQVRVASGTPVGLVLIGDYKGTLPCADCSGLDTELKLYAKGKFDTTDAFYIETRTYRGSRDGDLTFSDRGVWTVLKGDADAANATVYQLNPDKPVESQAYLVKDGGAALVQLDRALKKIDSEMNLTLRRMP
jgi:copper homeostasis protein (lipoprotein)